MKRSMRMPAFAIDAHTGDRARLRASLLEELAATVVAPEWLVGHPQG